MPAPITPAAANTSTAEHSAGRFSLPKPSTMAAAVAGIALFSLGAGLAATGVGVAPGALLMALGAGVGFAAPHISRMGEDPLNHAHDDRPAAIPGPGTVPANAVAYPPNHTQNYELPGADH